MACNRELSPLRSFKTPSWTGDVWPLLEAASCRDHVDAIVTNHDGCVVLHQPVQEEDRCAGQKNCCANRSDAKVGEDRRLREPRACKQGGPENGQTSALSKRAPNVALPVPAPQSGCLAVVKRDEESTRHKDSCDVRSDKGRGGRADRHSKSHAQEAQASQPPAGTAIGRTFDNVNAGS